MTVRYVNASKLVLPADILERMAKFVYPSNLVMPRSKDACHLWVGCTYTRDHNPWGRGKYFFQTKHNGKTVRSSTSAANLVYRAHRLDGKPIPAGMQVNHTCDVESCVNPIHLYLGTPVMNAHDIVRRGSARRQGMVEEVLWAHIDYWEGRGVHLPQWPAWLRRATANWGIK